MHAQDKLEGYERPARVGVPGPSFGERVRRLRTKRYENWFFVVIGGPLAVLANAVIAEVRWITPNAITVLGALIRLAAVPLLLVRHDALAVAALLVSNVMDAMDGGLARYRRTSSIAGAFLDKVSDAVGLVAVTSAFGYRAWLEGASPAIMMAGAFIGVSYLARCYMYWIVAYFELQRGAKPTAAPTAQEKPFGDLTFGERLVYYVRSTWRIVLLGEGDLYLWLSIGLLVGRLAETVAVLAVGMAILFVAITARHVRHVHALSERR